MGPVELRRGCEVADFPQIPLQFLSEIRMRDRDQSSSALPEGLAVEIHCAVLGHDPVDVPARRHDARSGRELFHDP